MFIRQCIKFFMGSALAIISGCVVVDTQPVCDVPELKHGKSYYNELVCSGVEFAESGKYADAVKSFEKAIAIRFHESTNFELFPKLAWARFKNGNFSAAKEDLKRAELSLSVFAGLIHCQETDEGFYLKNNAGIKLTGEISSEVSRIMCGAAYDYIYRRDSLDRVLLEAELVKRYMDVEKKIINVEK